MLLDGLFRPGDWAARLSHSLGLQGQVTTERRTLALARRRTGAEPLRIGFASDFHAGPTTHQSLLEQATAALIAERPDIVLLGGDFVTVRASAMRQLTPLLAAIHAPCGKFAVLGNHDLRADSATVIGGLRRAGVNLLSNSHSRLPAPFDDISICGLDDPTIGDPRADLALDGVDGVRIVLMHSPDGLLALEDRQFDLALCGHTHGGQIATPAGRAIVVPAGGLSRRFHMGWHPLNDGGTLLVSRGVGCSTVPFRMFATPEVHIITLTGA
jgi:predicted MPP superfamily phosphohydrolase